MRILITSLLAARMLIADVSHAQDSATPNEPSQAATFRLLQTLPPPVVFTDRAIEEIFESPSEWTCGTMTPWEFADHLKAIVPCPVILRRDHVIDTGPQGRVPEKLFLPTGKLSLFDGCRATLEGTTIALGRMPGCVVITSMEHAETLFLTRVYKTSEKLVEGANTGKETPWETPFDKFLRMTSGRWINEDGEGGRAMWLPASNSLVVYQNWQTHRDLHATLTAIHKGANLAPVVWYGRDEASLGMLSLNPSTERSAPPIGTTPFPRMYDSGQ